MVIRDEKRFPRKAPYGRGGGVRQWNRFDFMAVLCVPLAIMSLYHLVHRVREGKRMETWVESTAHVDSVWTASGGRHDQRIVCRFSYPFQGQDYESRRISVAGGQDNPWDEEWYERLKSAAQTRHLIPCYVNPANPAEAVLKRDVDWSDIGGPIGAFILCAGYALGLFVYRRISAA